MTRVLDLRSDTVSTPGGLMRQAMAAAEVGDDVFGDDPTVNRLEAIAAERLGKEAALFVPSGTMANLVAVMTHTRPGDEVLLGDQCHIFNSEAAGSARIANVQVHALPNGGDGSIRPADLRGAIRAPDLQTPGSALLCLEDTHNRCGGAAVPQDCLDELAAIAHERGLAVHLDGARVFNAAAATGVPPARIARDCDTVSFCLSKGLGCPVGSLLCGPGDFIARARRNRKMLGGGMRQAGILAAAGLYALEHDIARLPDDHANARRLAEGLAALGPFHLDPPQTNIVIARVVRGTVEGWIAAFREAGVLAVPFGAGRLRMVTHIDIGKDDIDVALARIERAVGAFAA